MLTKLCNLKQELAGLAIKLFSNRPSGAKKQILHSFIIKNTHFQAVFNLCFTCCRAILSFG